MSQSDNETEFYSAEITGVSAAPDEMSAGTDEHNSNQSGIGNAPESTRYSAVLDCLDDLGLSVSDLFELINRELTYRRWSSSAGVWRS